ncbi:MAG: thiamine phosphate synthase [Planctomycetes bacterium]|nr:thiamine phosphate synthase [Planctomycetota bacterium]
MSTSLSVDRLIADGRSLSREHDAEGTVTSEFLLLTLLQNDQFLTTRLSEMGLDFANLERDILGETISIPTLDDLFRFDDSVDRSATGRILDVNANRARESLRILDDYARFVLNDPLLTREIKELRHELTALLAQLPEGLLIGSRETLNDVGTTITASGEMDRSSPREVARINLKRVQESLRSLEEYGKIVKAEFALGIEQLRYRSYNLDKVILIGTDVRTVLDQTRLYVLLTASQCLAALDWTITEAAGGGAQIFQLREKELDDRCLLERAREFRRWTRQAGVLFIMNDRSDIARLVEADGVHLGQDDMPVHEARRILGPDFLIGVSTHNIEQVRQAVLDGANYIGVGPAFRSETKSFDALAGLEFVKAALAETSLPAFVIGGINERTIGDAIAVGAKRVAVSAAIACAEDPRTAARCLHDALRQVANPK